MTETNEGTDQLRQPADEALRELEVSRRELKAAITNALAPFRMEDFDHLLDAIDRVISSWVVHRVALLEIRALQSSRLRLVRKVAREGFGS
jgi:hypothetical protein